VVAGEWNLFQRQRVQVSRRGVVESAGEVRRRVAGEWNLFTRHMVQVSRRRVVERAGEVRRRVAGEEEEVVALLQPRAAVAAVRCRVAGTRAATVIAERM
jgi:hypothetical protein